MRRLILLFVLAMTFAGASADDNKKGANTLGNPRYKEYADSLTKIGDYHFFETGNFKKAVLSYFDAYRKGGVKAALMLGCCYAEGIEVNLDMDRALELWEQAAEAGNADAAMKLGECYMYGFGVLRFDLEKSFKWYEIAYELGATEAAYSLGLFYRSGSVVEKDEEKALKYWREAADYGMKEAQAALGLEYFEGKNTKRNMLDAVKYLKMAADQGEPKAAFYAGLCCEMGYGMPIEDYVSAAYYYMVAADAEVPEAQVHLANMYFNGLGVEENVDRGNYWLKQAQLNGFVLKSEEKE